MTELEAPDFAGGGAGEFGDEFEFARALVSGKAGNDEIEKGGGEGGITAKARTEHDPGDGLGEAVLVLMHDDGDFSDGFVFEQDVFNLHRADPDATNLEHVVGAAGEPVVSVLILIKLIAGAKPVAMDGLLRALVPVPVGGT